MNIEVVTKDGVFHGWNELRVLPERGELTVYKLGTGWTPVEHLIVGGREMLWLTKKGLFMRELTEGELAARQFRLLKKENELLTKTISEMSLEAEQTRLEMQKLRKEIRDWKGLP